MVTRDSENGGRWGVCGEGDAIILSMKRGIDFADGAIIVETSKSNYIT